MRLLMLKFLCGSLALILLGLMPGGALGQHKMGGTLGVDINAYNFENDIGDTLKVAADRILSTQKLDFSFSGPFVNDYFASYTGKLQLKGLQLHAGTSGGETTDYINPSLTGYGGSLLFFGDRKYPLRIYTTKSEVHSVRYEAGNRSKVNLVETGLAVVRRYRTESERSGAVWSYSPRESVEINAEFRTNRSQTSRQYDFDENRDIWVDYWLGPETSNDYHEITIENVIEDRAVRVLVDGVDVGTVPAGGELRLVDLRLSGGLDSRLTTGIHVVDFLPEGLNILGGQSIDVQRDMVWVVSFTEPLGAKDLDDNTDSVSATMRLGGEGAFLNNTKFEYSDKVEKIQGSTTGAVSIGNDATYELSRNTNLRATTEYATNAKTVIGASNRETRNFKHETIGVWQKPRGASASLSHSYDNSSSISKGNEVSNNKNAFLASFRQPTKWNGYNFGAAATADFLSDSSGKSDKTYATTLSNGLAVRYLGVRWKPQHDFKSTFSFSEPASTTAQDYVSRFVLEGNRSKLGPLGEVVFKGVHNRNWRYTGPSSNVTDKFSLSVNLARRLGQHTRLDVGGNVQSENSVSKLEAVGGGPVPNVAQLPDKSNQSVAMNLRTMPWQNFNIGLTANVGKTTDVSTRTITLRVSYVIPKLEIPISTFLLSDNKAIEGADRDQTKLQLESKVQYKFRKIKLAITHSLIKEQLATEVYNYSEFVATVSRLFDVY